MSYFFLFIIFKLFLLFCIPLTCIRQIYKTSVTTQTTVNSEMYANGVKIHVCDVKIRDEGMINLYISKQQSDFAITRGIKNIKNKKK